MWIRRYCAWAACMGFGVLGAQAKCDAPPGSPAALNVYQGQSGRPPEFVNPSMPEGATATELEIWTQSGGVSSLFARVWVNASTMFFPVWDENGVNRTNWILRGPGPGGHLLFPAGTYLAQWRGYNACGIGEWSWPVRFTVTHVTDLKTTLTWGKSLIRNGESVDFGWSNNFMESQYQIQIRRGSTIVRSKTGSGALESEKLWNWNGYADEPATPGRELPNGTYAFRVRAYSPVLNQWSPWASRTFRIARGMPAKPVLSFSQRDFNGYFNKSPRPFFFANYDSWEKSPRWTYFDIRRKIGGRTQVVRRQWVANFNEWGYGFGYNRACKFFVGGAHAFRDLPAGQYVWRVRAWNGRGALQSRWTSFKTNRVVAAGKLAAPGIDCFSGGTSYTWGAVPNAYAYNLQVWSNGALIKNYANLDPRTGRDNVGIENGPIPCGGAFVRKTGVFFWRPDALPAGTYQIRIQAVNKGNPAGRRLSAWSMITPDYVVP